MTRGPEEKRHLPPSGACGDHRHSPSTERSSTLHTQGPQGEGQRDAVVRAECAASSLRAAGPGGGKEGSVLETPSEGRETRGEDHKGKCGRKTGGEGGRG